MHSSRSATSPAAAWRSYGQADHARARHVERQAGRGHEGRALGSRGARLETAEDRDHQQGRAHRRAFRSQPRPVPARIPCRRLFRQEGFPRRRARGLQCRRGSLSRAAALLAVELHHLQGKLMKRFLFLIAFFSSVAAAQSWPTKPVRVIVTFSPGGSSDIVARLVAVPLQAELGQSVIVDNKPGAGGTIGALEAARAAPDGYTLLLSNSAPISISPAMQDEPRYDPVKSFSHVSYIGSVANVFVVHPSVPAKNMNELVAWIRAEKNPVNYGSGGIGSIGHIVGET